MSGEGVTRNPASFAETISDNATTHTPSRGVYIGVAKDYDFNVGGAWVGFKGTVAGSIIPIVAVGARVTSGSAAPTAGDIVFLR